MPEKRLCNQIVQPITYNTHTHQVQNLFELVFRLFLNPDDFTRNRFEKW